MAHTNGAQVRNTLLLTLGAFIWGVAFVAQSVGSGYVGPYTFLASRSWLACLFLLGVLAVQRRVRAAERARPTVAQNPRALLVGGGLCGAMLFAASAAQQIGIAGTTAAEASFITALYVVLVPVLGIAAGRRPGLRLWLCVAASVAGLYLLCLAGTGSLRFTGSEWMLLLCALLFTFQILLVGHYSARLDGLLLSLMEFFATAVLATVCMLLWEHPTLAQLQSAAVAIVYCGILSSGVGYTLQIVGQRNLDPAIASLAMCLESVFGALAGWLLLGQTLSPVELLGCALMFAAIVAAQLPGKA